MLVQVDFLKVNEMGKHGLIDIRPCSDSFTFHVESTGVLDAEEIVLQAVHILQTKLDTVGVRSFLCLVLLSISYVILRANLT